MFFQSTLQFRSYDADSKSQKINDWIEEFIGVRNGLNKALIEIHGLLANVCDTSKPNILSRANYDRITEVYRESNELVKYAEAVNDYSVEALSARVNFIDRLLGRDDRLWYWANENYVAIDHLRNAYDELLLVCGKPGQFLSNDAVEEIRSWRDVLLEGVDYALMDVIEERTDEYTG